MANSRMLRAITNRSPFFFFFSKTLINPSPSFSLLSSFPFSSRRKSNSSNSSDVAKREADDGEVLSFVYNRDPNSPPNLFVVQPRLRPDSLFQSKLNEALNLANSLEEQRDGFYQEDFDSKKMPPHLVVQNPSSRSVKSDTYFGPGTVDNIKCHLRALESQGRLDAVFVNAILSGIQQRNLEMAWGKSVLDRVGLIIEIFHAHAETKEAKLQSELAALMYKKSRLVRVRGPGGRLTFGTGGEAQVVSARGRGSGGRGFIGGAGETELQLQRRRIQERRTYLLSQIEEVRRTRVVQRSARKRHGGSYGQGLATVSVVGYTNAGKSTLVSALSESDLYSENRLFATVDPRLRSVILPSGRKVLLSDTVGFISDLPVQLVEAFHATLEEVVEADLLVHVLDASAPDLDLQRTTVLEVLQQIGVSEEKIQNMIEVWNKIDLLNKDIGVDEEHDEFLSGNKENEETVSGEEYVCGVEGEDETFSEEDETFSGGDCLDGNEKEDGSFASDQEECDIASDLSSEEAMESFKIRQASSFEQQGIDFDTSCEAKAGEHVKTSAAMRVGLQELLNVIDEKLSSENSVVTRRVGPFDRKWRPSCTEDTDKAA